MSLHKTQAFIDDILKGYNEESLSDDCIYWPYGNNGKYGHIRRNKKNLFVHRYILCIITGEDYDYNFQAAHFCGHSFCVNPKHISWKTIKENWEDTIRHDTLVYGEKSHYTKLTSDEVLAIREQKDKYLPKTLAKMYKVSVTHIHKILRNEKRKFDGKE